MLMHRLLRRRRGLAWLDAGKRRYAVSVARAGRIVAVVKVRADDADDAAVKATRYVAANLYALNVKEAEEPGGQES